MWSVGKFIDVGIAIGLWAERIASSQNKHIVCIIQILYILIKFFLIDLLNSQRHVQFSKCDCDFVFYMVDSHYLW